MTGQKGSLFLIPCPISEGKISSIAHETLEILHKTTHFIVERAKTARHFIKAAGHPIHVSQLVIEEMTDNIKNHENTLQKLLTGTDIGVISEAGNPCIADPGALLVTWAHQHDIRIVPLIGPSSILLALIASGLNGQNFAFNGYLSNKKPELTTHLRQLEIKVGKGRQTQIWMETPYRNQFMIETCLQTFQGNTRLCIACDINAPTEEIRTMTISAWKKTKTDHYHKRLCIYLIG